MKKIRLGIMALLAFSWVGCRQTEQKAALPVIDLGKDYPEREWKVTDLFDVEYVPLETSDSFLIGERVTKVGDRYVVACSENQILLFDRKTGKGISRFGHHGQGKGEYSNILGILLDEAAEELYVNDYFSGKVQVYGLPRGEYKRTLSLPDGRICSELEVCGDYLLAYDETLRRQETGTKPEQAAYYLLLSKQDGSVAKELPLPIVSSRSPRVSLGSGMYMQGFVPNAFVSSPDGSWLLHEISSDTVYQYLPSTGRLKPWFSVLPSQAPPRMLGLGIMTDRYCFMKVCDLVATLSGDGNLSGPGEATLAYDRETGEIVRCAVFMGDFHGKWPVDLISRPQNRSELAGFVELPAHALVDFLKQEALAGPLKDIASRLDAEDNPVLMLMKYKKE